ncbi:hypothetical protein P280DRAFT_231413 [Massarina eburnea CBS 473.64]|uniref:Uncharacterized protein n=1 Tax=Massarina eburnea CBS 473.64 TaxID=1395130 RepID=A0A6A6SC25_9PLEO|nr:hypothetical protein P280DRAFT_231413 [Massarina eburnea CBS 473.64]
MGFEFSLNTSRSTSQRRQRTARVRCASDHALIFFASSMFLLHRRTCVSHSPPQRLSCCYSRQRRWDRESSSAPSCFRVVVVLGGAWCVVGEEDEVEIIQGTMVRDGDEGLGVPRKSNMDIVHEKSDDKAVKAVNAAVAAGCLRRLSTPLTHDVTMSLFVHPVVPSGPMRQASTRRTSLKSTSPRITLRAFQFLQLTTVSNC